MADAKLQRVGMLHPIFVNGLANFTSFTLDATTDQLEFVFRMPEAATITRLGFRYGLRTGTPPTYIASLQGVDGSGNPDGIIKGGGTPASVTFTPPANATWDGTYRNVTLDNSYAAVRGEELALVIAYSSGTVNGSNNSSIISRGDGVITNYPYVIENNAGSRSRPAAHTIFSVGSASKWFGLPVLTSTTVTFDSTTTPDEIGMRFNMPGGFGDTYKVVGVSARLRLAAGTTMVVALYDGTTALQNVTIDGDAARTAAAGRNHDIYFDEVSLSTLNFGSTYRVAFQPQNAGTFTLDYASFNANEDLSAYDSGEEFYYTSRTDAGAWTDDTARRPVMELILADWTEPTSSTSVHFIGG